MRGRRIVTQWKKALEIRFCQSRSMTSAVDVSISKDMSFGFTGEYQAAQATFMKRNFRYGNVCVLFSSSFNFVHALHCLFARFYG